MARWRRGVGVPIVSVVGFALLLWGCAQTTRINEDLTSDRLQRAGKSVAVMRIGSASPACEHVAVLLGVRDGAGFRPSTWLKVYNVKSLSEPAVTEAVLAPGEYHVVAYQCASGKRVKGVDAKADANSYARSYAHFALGPDEVINVGFLHIHAVRTGRNAFGRPVKVNVAVTDWPVAELERYRVKRPKMYQQMRTRLMSVSASESGGGTLDCRRLMELKAAGKVQSVPAECKTGRMPTGKSGSAARGG